jgi:hypothetical protein
MAEEADRLRSSLTLSEYSNNLPESTEGKPPIATTPAREAIRPTGKAGKKVSFGADAEAG